eukprot:Skav226672  [mRNA]  locus=scaffold861:300918:303998:+ [translate_table: standard]
MFILNVDPRCRVTPEWFFARAATLTTLWILIFGILAHYTPSLPAGMYVVDYKWKILPTIWAQEGYNKRASFHFATYPVVLFLLTIVGSLAPSTICRNRPYADHGVWSIQHKAGHKVEDFFENPRDGRRCSAPLLKTQPLGSRPTTSVSTTRAQSSSSAFAKQCRKMARKEVTPVLKFDQAFDMAYRLAVKRLAADRRQEQVSLNASHISEVLGPSGGKSGKLPFVRSKEESLWAVQVLRKVGEKLTAEDRGRYKSRRRSSVKESFASFGDVVFAAQLARN